MPADPVDTAGGTPAAAAISASDAARVTVVHIESATAAAVIGGAATNAAAGISATPGTATAAGAAAVVGPAAAAASGAAAPERKASAAEVLAERPVQHVAPAAAAERKTAAKAPELRRAVDSSYLNMIFICWILEVSETVFGFGVLESFPPCEIQSPGSGFSQEPDPEPCIY